jgi:hypothetical protein
LPQAAAAPDGHVVARAADNSLTQLQLTGPVVVAGLPATKQVQAAPLVVDAQLLLLTRLASKSTDSSETCTGSSAPPSPQKRARALTATWLVSGKRVCAADVAGRVPMAKLLSYKAITFNATSLDNKELSFNAVVLWLPLLDSPHSATATVLVQTEPKVEGKTSSAKPQEWWAWLRG